MSRGKPILATACNGPADIIVEGETGWLTPIDDAATFAAAILNAMVDPDLQIKGMNGYERLVKHYLPLPMGKKLLESLSNLGVRWI
jgi:glycosyltransferase involved in cell wall biosynthesis